VKDVWQNNLEDEIRTLQSLVSSYPYIAVSVEYPGVIAKPLGTFKNAADHIFQTLVANINMQPLTISLAFFDHNGNRPPGTCCWIFNFHHSTKTDFSLPNYPLRPMSLLSRIETDGIAFNHFAEVLTTSGLVMNPDTTWLSSSIGDDYAFLMKILLGDLLPRREQDFYELLAIFFPVLYDLRYLMKSCKTLAGSLEDVAASLSVSRIGPPSSSGSTAILIGSVFFVMRKVFL
ncbi:uncharacterized protein MONBRDRAFT_1697, partial [Monosiga brevicollis MX1]